MTKHAEVIALERWTGLGDGASLRHYHADVRRGYFSDGYGQLMADAMGSGFKGVFAEVDPRDWSKICLDGGTLNERLPASFFESYFRFLEREDPSFAREAGDAEGLRRLLKLQSHAAIGVESETVADGSERSANRFVTSVDGNGGFSTVPTGLELGSFLFSDALVSIRMHILARLMADGKIPKGPILEFQGADHLSAKQFFMRYPELAMEVVLRSLPEMLASDASDILGRIKKKVGKIEKGMEDPEWERIVRRIGTISFMNSRYRIEPHVYKSDFFTEYGTDPASALPSEAEMAGILSAVTSLQGDSESEA